MAQFRYVFNTFNIYFGIFLAAVYIFTFLPMIRYRKRYNNSFYLILLVIASVEFLTILSSNIFASDCFINSKCPGPKIFSKIEALWATWAFHFYFFGHFLIAVNRFCAVAYWSNLNIIWSKCRTCIYLGVAGLLTFTVKHFSSDIVLQSKGWFSSNNKCKIIIFYAWL